MTIGFEQLQSTQPNNWRYGSVIPTIKPGITYLNGTSGIDGSNGSYTYDIRQGWLLGFITASSTYCPLKRSRVNGTTGTVTSVVLDNAAAFAVGDIVTIGADTNRTISAIDYDTNTITVGSTAVDDNDVVFGSGVLDGSGTFAGILDTSTVRLRNWDNTAAENRPCSVAIGGSADTGNVYGDIAAVLAGGASAHPLLKSFTFWTAGVLAG